eukprot:1236799-Prymnesium_polylepis.1
MEGLLKANKVRARARARSAALPAMCCARRQPRVRVRPPNDASHRAAPRRTSHMPLPCRAVARRAHRTR